MYISKFKPFIAYSGFFAQSLDLLCTAGHDGYFKRLNPAWKRMLGCTIEKLQNRPFLDFVHPDDRQATLAEVAVLAGGAPTIAFENRYRCKDGPYRWLQWNARPGPGYQPGGPGADRDCGGTRGPRLNFYLPDNQ